MAIKKTNDIANEADSKYSNQRGKRANIEERLDDTTHNDNPYDDAIQYISKKVDEVVDELNLSDSSKVITSGQASAITANTAKVGISTAQADEIAVNTAKVGISTTQADEITANTAKVGITTTQAGHITANNAKVGTTSTERSRIAANHAKVGISTVQAAIVDSLHPEGGALIPTTTEKHTVSLSVTNSRGAYALVFTMVDGTGKNPVTKTATVNLS